MCAQWAAPFGAHHSQCSVKRRGRSIEKLFRRYGGNASRLTDLVRSSITFDTLQQLCDCLERGILADGSVAAPHCKNRFDPAYDGKESAGYRNFAIYFTISNEYTICRGLDKHVCELQLGITAIDRLKHADGHSRYVAYRNLSAN